MCQLWRFTKEALPILAPIFTLFAAGAAWLSAANSNKSVKHQREALKYQKANEILEYRYSKEFFTAKKALGEFRDRFGEKEPWVREKGIGSYFVQERDKVNDLDGKRHDFMTYFSKLYDLRVAGLVNDSEMVVYVNRGELSLLLNVVEPLEMELKKLIGQLDPDSRPSDPKRNPLFEYFRSIKDTISV